MLPRRFMGRQRSLFMEHLKEAVAFFCQNYWVLHEQFTRVVVMANEESAKPVKVIESAVFQDPLKRRRVLQAALQKPTPGIVRNTLETGGPFQHVTTPWHASLHGSVVEAPAALK